jgi:hypothetical protein
MKYDEVQLHPCPRLPSKEFLKRAVKQLCEAQNKMLGFKENRLPNKQWLLNILVSLNPDHEVFQKGYVHSK